MLIGVMADTHDNLPMVEKAVRILNEEGVQLVLHAGDYVAPFLIPKLSELDAKVIGVLGNNDGDPQLLEKKMEEQGDMEMRGHFGEVSVDDLKIALLHGDEGELLKVLIECGSFDVVVCGHTHQAEITQRGKTLVLNPGEICGYLSGRPTLALFDTDRQTAKILKLVHKVRE